MESWIIGSSVRASFGQGTAGKEAAESALLCSAGCSCMARSPSHLQLFGMPGWRELIVCSCGSPSRSVPLLLVCSEGRREEVGARQAAQDGQVCHSITSSQWGESLPELGIEP